MTTPDVDTAFGRLRASPDFAEWPDASLRELAALGEILWLKRGALLFRQGLPARSIFVVLEGAMQFSRSRPDGTDFVIGYYAPGQPFGLTALFDHQFVEFDARAKADTALLRVDRERLRPYLLEHPALLLSLAGAWSNRRRQVYEQLEVVSTMPLRQRLARVILRLAASFGQAGDEGLRISIRVSQDDLAALAAASRQRVHVEFKALVAEGVIASRYGSIVVINSAGLQQRAGRTALEPS
jgi:CRP/FNR family transcriptional regulator, cyclic AMP receptor protein